MAKKKKGVGGTSAHEDEVGLVHSLVNQGYKMKLQFQIQKGKEALEAYETKGKKKKLKDGELDEDPTYMVDVKTLESAARWCSYNKVMPTTVETESMRDTVSELDAIRKKQRGRICTPTANQ